MDANRRKNFTSNKSIDVVASNATNENGSNNHAAANGTISSSTESSDSVEPPKLPLKDNKDFHENNVRVEEIKSEQRKRDVIVEERSDSNQSNEKGSDDVLCSVLSSSNEISLPESGRDGLRSFDLNSMSASPVFSSAPTNNHDSNSSIEKQLNGDDKNCNRNYHQDYRTFNGIINRHDNDYEKSRNDDRTMGTNVRYDNDKADTNEQRINKCTHDIDVSINSNSIETVTNTLHDNQLSEDQKDINNYQTETNSTVKLIAENSTEDCISTDTISSNSFDVKPIKCPTDRSQTSSESDEIGCKENEGKSDDFTKTNQSKKSVMSDDDLLKMPLLGSKNSSGNNTTVYNAIDRPNIPACKGNTDDNYDEKPVAYNEYVNLLCDTDRNGIFTKNTKRNANDESRPLLRQISCDNTTVIQKIQRRSSSRPRSIVKSPSTQNFSSNTHDKFEINRKPRLSIQCTGSDPERPVLHVQFLSQQHTDSNDSIKKNLLINVNSPTSGEHDSYQNSASQCDSTDKPPEELIHQMPARGILRTSRLRSSISSSSSGSTSSSSDSSSSDDVSQFAEANPPDGGYGWVVVFASFMVNLIADGITFSFGVIYVELLNYFGEGKAKTAWIGSLFMAMPLLSGPIASFLTDRFGCRKVTIIGSILASIGFFVSSFTDSVEMLCLTFGIFAGFGLSLCYVAAVVIVAYYFDKKRSFATGLSVCGSGIGTFLFAPLTQMLIDEYGWRGTTIILSGMFLNITVCGMLMRDLEWTTYKSKQKAKLRKKRNKLGISAESFSASNSTNTGGTTSNLHKDDNNGNDGDPSDENNGDNCLANQAELMDDPRLFSSLITLPTFVKNGEKVNFQLIRQRVQPANEMHFFLHITQVPVEVLELMSANKHVHNVLLKNYPGLAHSRSFSQPLTSSHHSHGSNAPLENGLSLNSPNENDNEIGHLKSKGRRIQNEQEFLSWMKHDHHIHHAKDVRIIMVGISNANNSNPFLMSFLTFNFSTEIRPLI